MCDSFLSMRLLDKGLGIWQILSSEQVTDIISVSGFDFALLDLEHGLHNPQTIQNCMFTAKSSGIGVIARIPSLTYPYIVQIIDTGIDGILVPHVETINDLKEAINSIFLHPDGSKSFSPFVPRFSYGANIARFTQNPLLGILLESEKGLNNSDSLLSHSNVDFVYFGAYDLSVEIGCSGDIFSKHIVERLDLLTQCAKANDKSIMAIYRSEKELQMLLDIGVNLPIASVDTLNLNMKLSKEVEVYKRHVK